MSKKRGKPKRQMTITSIPLENTEMEQILENVKPKLYQKKLDINPRKGKIHKGMAQYKNIKFDFGRKASVTPQYVKAL